MQETQRKITLNTQKMFLTSGRRVYKTEGFIMLTKKVMSADVFISRIAEALFAQKVTLPYGKCYMAETEDKRYTLHFCMRANGSGQSDIIFFGYLCSRPDEGGTDRKLTEYLLSHKEIVFTLKTSAEDEQDLSRLYLVSDGDGSVNFPLLNDVQRSIVQTEDANMLVQGIAGSGKTNVCVEKIVYCACRNYRGKVLYSTFSRGLLTETQNRVSLFIKNIEDFVRFYESGNVVFLDTNHKAAIENKLGILFDTDDDGDIIAALKRIAKFLKNNVDYKLIGDIYGGQFENKHIADEQFFIKEYIGERRNYRLSGALDRIKNIALEIIYKEIYGMIFGKYETEKPCEMMGREEYVEARRDSFTRNECEVIYSVAVDYGQYLAKNNLTDNNAMSRQLLSVISAPLYSVAVIDEVQDFTQVNLCLMKALSRKLFCVGDALQMINPSYFNFGYLKRLMYGDVTGVKELKHNYRSTQKIESIAERLGQLNIARFGTHSFVLKGQSVSSSLPSAAVFVQDKDFAQSLGDRKFENITVVVASQSKKQQLRRKLSKVEILTVAEAKGLERNTVILVDVLSDNADKWSYLENAALNRKTADENSVFRYYFNLFYVGISRARQYLFVSEATYPKMFAGLINDCFEKKNRQSALSYLGEVAGKIELDDEELLDRIEKFCSLEQYANAAFAAERISDDALMNEQLAYIYVHEHFLRYGNVRDAGVEFWKRGFDTRAREMFTKSGDTQLFPLMDACKAGGGALDVDIVKFFPIIGGNEVAAKLILETVESDLRQTTQRQRAINEALKRKRK